MKIIRYQLMTEVNHGTQEEPNIEQVFTPCELCCKDDDYKSALSLARKEAYNGEYTVEDIEDPITEPSQLDQIEAQVTYTAMMTDTLLEE